VGVSAIREHFLPDELTHKTERLAEQDGQNPRLCKKTKAGIPPGK
jgi:hypothetical protein